MQKNEWVHARWMNAALLGAALALGGCASGELPADRWTLDKPEAVTGSNVPRKDLSNSNVRQIDKRDIESGRTTVPSMPLPDATK